MPRCNSCTTRTIPPPTRFWTAIVPPARKTPCPTRFRLRHICSPTSTGSAYWRESSSRPQDPRPDAVQAAAEGVAERDRRGILESEGRTDEKQSAEKKKKRDL